MNITFTTAVRDLRSIASYNKSVLTWNNKKVIYVASGLIRLLGNNFGLTIRFDVDSAKPEKGFHYLTGLNSKSKPIPRTEENKYLWNTNNYFYVSALEPEISSPWFTDWRDFHVCNQVANLFLPENSRDKSYLIQIDIDSNNKFFQIYGINPVAIYGRQPHSHYDFNRKFRIYPVQLNFHQKLKSEEYISLKYSQKNSLLNIYSDTYELVLCYSEVNTMDRVKLTQLLADSAPSTKLNTWFSYEGDSRFTYYLVAEWGMYYLLTETLGTLNYFKIDLPQGITIPRNTFIAAKLLNTFLPIIDKYENVHLALNHNYGGRHLLYQNDQVIGTLMGVRIDHSTNDNAGKIDKIIAEKPGLQ